MLCPRQRCRESQWKCGKKSSNDKWDGNWNYCNLKYVGEDETSDQSKSGTHPMLISVWYIVV